MNRSIVFGLVLIVQMAVSCNINHEVNLNDLKEWRLEGSVKSISEINYSSTGKYSTHLLFNTDGFVQEQSTYNPDSSLIRKWKFEYNGQNLKSARSCYVLNDSLSEILYYTYNENGKIVEEKLVNTHGTLISNVEHEYDKNQNEIERRFIDENEKVQGQISYRYNDKNILTEVISFNNIIHQHWRQKYFYNQKGLNVEILFLSMNDSLLNRSTYTYTPDRQVSESCNYNSKNILTVKTMYNYDNQLNIINKVIYYPLENTTEKNTFEYLYDKYKNWTSQKTYTNNEISDITVRELEYYK